MEGGNVTPSSGWFVTGEPIEIEAIASNDYYFSNWVGTGNGSYTGDNNPTTIILDGPITQTAHFLPYTQIQVTTKPTGLDIVVDTIIYTSPQSFNWIPGSLHEIGVLSPQSDVAGIRYLFEIWNDGYDQTHQIITPEEPTTYQCDFFTQYYLTMDADTGGIVTPSSNWYYEADEVSIGAWPTSGFYFTDWIGNGSGSYTGTNTSAVITMDEPITQTARFSPNSGITFTSLPESLNILVDGNSYKTP